MDTDPTHPASVRRRCAGAAAVAGLVLGGLFFAAALPVMLWSTRKEFDEVVFHLPAVLKFAREWPRFDFESYTSATTPGFHLVLAAVARFVTDDVRVLRVVAGLFTAGLVATAGAAVARRVGALAGVALCLPLLCSPYVFRQGVWIIPQNAGWWGVLVVLVVALRPRVDRVTYLGGAAALAALVFVRQSHLWAAASLWLAAWLGAGSSAGLLPDERDAAEGNGFAPRVRRAAAMLVATLPAFLVVAWFVRLWGGAVPRLYQAGAAETVVPPGEQAHVITGGSPAAPAIVLAIAALTGPFFFPFVWPHFTRALRGDRRRVLAALAAGALLGLLIGVLPVTTYSVEAGRWSGIWNAVRRLPTFADRSPVVAALSAAGGAMVAAWFVATGRRDRWVFLGSLVAFTAAQCFAAVAWQRYYEPFLLMLFPLLVARTIGRHAGDKARAGDPVSPAPRPPALAIAGPLVLAAGLAALTGMTMLNALGLGTKPPPETTTAPTAAPQDV